MGFRRQWLLAYGLFCCHARAGYVYKGCYDASGLELTSQGQYTWQSVSYCEQQCNGSLLVALKNGDECLCGDSLDVLDSAETGTCNVECNGWPYATCGGEGSLDVYVDNGLSHSHASASSSSVTVTSTMKSSHASSSGSSDSGSSTASSSSAVPRSSQSSSVASSSSYSSSNVVSSSSAVPRSSQSSSVASSSSHSSSNVVSSSSAVPRSSQSSSVASSSSYSSSNVVSSSSAVPTTSYSSSSVLSSSSVVSTSSYSSSSVASSSSVVPTSSYSSSSTFSATLYAVATPHSSSAITTDTSTTIFSTDSTVYWTSVVPTYITTDGRGKDKTVYVTTTSVQTSSITVVSKPYNKSAGKKGGMSGGAIAGVVVGVVGGVVVITMAVCFYLWRRHVSRQEPDIEETKQYQPYSFGDADANPVAYYSSKSASNWRKASNSRSSSYGTVPAGFLSTSNSGSKGSLNSLLNIEDINANYTRKNFPSTVFEEPPSIYNGNQRFSTGSLPDMMQERSLRVANPDDEANRFSQRRFEDEDEDEEDNIFSTGSSGGSYIGPEPKYY